MLSGGYVFQGGCKAVFKITETKDFFEIYTPMTPGKRIFFFFLSFFPLLAPCELVILPDWQDYFNPFFVFVLFISLGALSLSVFIFWAAIAGLNLRMTFDKTRGVFLYSADALVVPIRRYKYPIASIAGLEVKEHESSEGNPSYSLKVIMSDRKEFNSGTSWSKEEVERGRDKVLSFLGLKGNLHHSL